MVSMGLEVRSFTAMVMKFEPWEPRHQGTQRREPLPTVRRLAAPKVWPGSLALEELGYGRTGGRSMPPGFRQFNEKRQELLLAGYGDPKEAGNSVNKGENP